MNVRVKVSDLLLKHLFRLDSACLNVHLNADWHLILLPIKMDVINVELYKLRFEPLQLNAVLAEDLTALVDQLI